MTRLIPPPPPPLPRPKQSRWEGELLRDWEAKLPGYARRVWHPERIGLGREDVVQELRLAIVLAARAYAQDSQAKPSEAFIGTVLRNTLTSIVRLTLAQKRAIENEDGFMQGAEEYIEGTHDLTDPEQPADAQMASAEDEEGFRGLVYLLRRSLSPAQFAVLHLRFAEEWPPELMVRVLGYADAPEWTCDNCGRRTSEDGARCCARPAPNRRGVPAGVAAQRMSQVIVRAKRDAVDFLHSIGVKTITAVMEDEHAPESR